MEKFLNVLKREINKIKSKPMLLVIMLVVPLIISITICETFKEGSPKNLPIAVFDADNSNLSRLITRMVDATPTCEVKYGVASLEEGRRMIVGGEIYALLVIPKDFKRDVYRGTNPQLVYYYNNQMLLIGGIITKDVNIAIQTVLSGIDAKIRMKKGMPKEVAISRVNLVKVDEHIKGNPYLNYSYLISLAAFAHTFQVLIAFLAIWSIGKEFKDGTSIEWMEAGGNSILTCLTAKLLPYTLGFMFIIFLIYGIYFIGYGAPFNGNLPFLFFATFVFVFAYQAIGIMYVALTTNLRLSLSCGAFYTALGFTFVGMTYPTLAMPAFARGYSALLPLRPYLSVLIDQTLRGIPIKYDIGYIWWMLALSCLGLVCIPRLKKAANDEKTWYKS